MFIKAFFVFLFSCGLLSATHLVVVTCSFNNEAYVQKYTESLACQTYRSWSLIYVNDCSSDRTGLLIEESVKKHGLSSKSTIIHNPKRQGAMANFYKTIHKIDPEAVVVCLDGDDRLSTPRSLEIIANAYCDKKTWMTYGNYIVEPPTVKSICKPIPEAVMKNNTFRAHLWTTSHAKTFYAKLFQKIKKEDLCYKGQFVPVASDVAFMMPMLEMASHGHIKFITDTLYVYNYQNPLNDQKKQQALVTAVEKHIRGLKPYKPL